MAYIDIEESGMVFRVDEAKLFHLEASELMRKMPDRTKTPEFITYDDARRCITILEAKTSAPNTKGDPDAFKKWIGDIRDKFQTAMQIFHAVMLGRHRIDLSKEMGEEFNKLNLKKADYKFFLIVKNQDKASLDGLYNSVKSNLNCLVKWWGIPDRNIKVMNEEKARSMNLIV